jgi:hypothetical protein
LPSLETGIPSIQAGGDFSSEHTRLTLCVVRCSLLGGSGRSNQVGGDLLHTMDVIGLSRVSTWAFGPRNLMKITSRRRAEWNRLGAARLSSQWRS